MYRKLLVGGCVAASVGVGLPVGCTVLVLLVVLASVEMYAIMHIYILQRCVCVCVCVCVASMYVDVVQWGCSYLLPVSLCW